jgi:multicomponent Na+:H+ antiporter subunit D
VDVGNWVGAIVVGGSSLLTAAYFLKLFERLFVLEPTEEVVATATEPEPRIVGTVLTLGAAVVLIGAFNAVLVSQVLRPIADRLVG